MDRLHTAADDRPMVTLLIDTYYDLDVAGLLENAHPGGVGNADVSAAELDARAGRNEQRVDAYEKAYLASLAEVGRERDITVQVTWDAAQYHRATADASGDDKRLAQLVYQDAHDRTPAPAGVPA